VSIYLERCFMELLEGTLTVERVATLGGGTVLVVAKRRGPLEGIHYIELAVPADTAPSVGELIRITVTTTAEA
jgi:hypothetical protein